MPKNVKTLFSSAHNIEQELATTDLVVGAVLIPGAKAPQPHHPPYAQTDEKRKCAGRCSHRPRRLF